MEKIDLAGFDDCQADALAVFVSEDKSGPASGPVADLLKEAEAYTEFSGEKDKMMMLYGPKAADFKRVLFLGVGKREKLTAESFRAGAGKAVKKCMDAGLSSLAVAVYPMTETCTLTDMVRAAAEGALLANHVFDAYKSEKKKTPLSAVTLVSESGMPEAARAALDTAAVVCNAALKAREWVNTPSNDKKPEMLAQTVVMAAQEAGLAVTVMGEAELSEQKFGALLSVAAGSNSRPRLVALDLNPPGARKTVALVGKGVTFDSGGINIKPSAGMEEMKSDMAGTAVVAATMLAMAKIKCGLRIVGIMPMVENMPSGTATRPGDVITAYSGKTVEITNTDAEGRLILADALSWAQKTYAPDVVVDLATLTGACVVALGEQIAGLFCQNEALSQELMASSEKTRERLWQMPLPDDYDKLLESEIADVANCAKDRWGGAITAALFLAKFTESTPWAHLDIAGPAFAKKAGPYCPAGGTGFGVRLLCDWICGLAR